MREIDLRAFWGLFIQNLKIIVIAMAVVGMAAGGATILFAEDQYVSKCSMYVMNIAKDSAGITSGISSAGLDASQRMVNEYIEIVRSESVLVEVQSVLRGQNYNLSIAQIRSALNMTPKNETALMEISATTGNPNLSKALCDAVQQCAPDKVNEVMLGLGTITKVDTASLGSRSARGTTRNAVIGAVLAAALCYGLFLVNYLIDNTIKDEKDFKNRYNVNLLGVVPSFGSGNDKKKSKKGDKNHGSR